MKKKPDKPLPYDDAVPYDGIQAYLCRKTGVVLTPQQIGKHITSRNIRTVTKPRKYGGGVFTRKAWLDDFIEKNS
ncbi:MAG: hypothetical protein GQ565_02955 [Candidatus Aegiribacteria sp.]|nr:hypothetical protein [Candidatus Aegiribacteria sp.]